MPYNHLPLTGRLMRMALDVAVVAVVLALAYYLVLRPMSLTDLPGPTVSPLPDSAVTVVDVKPPLLPRPVTVVPRIEGEPLVVPLPQSGVSTVAEIPGTDSVVVVALRPRTRLFPDWRPEPDLLRFFAPDGTVVSPGAVRLTRTPRPLIGFPFEVKIGVSFDRHGTGYTAGMNLIRVGPIKAGLTGTYSPNHPDGGHFGAELVTDVLPGSEVAVGVTLRRELFIGVRYVIAL